MTAVLKIVDDGQIPEFKFTPDQLLAIEAKRVELTEAIALASEVSVQDAETLAESDTWTRVLLKERDSLEAVRTSATKPINAILRVINGGLNPLIKTIDVAVAGLKAKSGEYIVAERQRQAAAYAAAQAAHVQGQHVQAVTSLATAQAATTEVGGGTTVVEEWTVERVVPDLVTRDWLVPDLARMQAHAAATPANVEPVPVAGVIFKKVARLIVRRK